MKHENDMIAAILAFSPSLPGGAPLSREALERAPADLVERQYDRIRSLRDRHEEHRALLEKYAVGEERLRNHRATVATEVERIFGRQQQQSQREGIVTAARREVEVLLETPAERESLAALEAAALEAAILSVRDRSLSKIYRFKIETKKRERQEFRGAAAARRYGTILERYKKAAGKAFIRSQQQLLLLQQQGVSASVISAQTGIDEKEVRQFFQFLNDPAKLQVATDEVAKVVGVGVRPSTIRAGNAQARRGKVVVRRHSRQKGG